ncbi:MAG TPA: primosomal protein [Demequina sp.]|nr:primosomal protein [Demequina sp.]
MSTNAREALRQLTGALEAHLEAVLARRSSEDAAVDDAFDAVAESFERYEEALDSTFGESLPIVLDDDLTESYDDDDDSDDDSDDDDDFDDSDDSDDGDDGDDQDDEDDDDAADPLPEGIDAHAVKNDDELDDDIEEFDLR